MNTGIYYTTQRVLSSQRQNQELQPENNRVLSLAQLIFSQNFASNSFSSSARMCCCTSC